MDIRIASSESTAGSFHISTSNPIKRVRSTTPHPQVHPVNDDQQSINSQTHDEVLLSEIVSSLKQFLYLTPAFPSTNKNTSSHHWAKLCLKGMLAIYCFLSFVMFSLDLYAQAPMAGGNTIDDQDSSSAFDDTSSAQRLSRLFSLQASNHMVLDPFIIRAQERNGDVVSACLWTRELSDFELLRSWASQWQGPISLLMTTTSKPDSSALSNLLHHLHDLSTNPVPGLSVHLLRIGMADQASSNSYLNLARLFASTSLVMLLPANISEPPPMSHDTAASQLSHSSMGFPAIVIGASNTVLNFSMIPPLSPMILRRDHPVWCTERFFLRRSRESEWTACLWQLWLDSFGDFVDVGISTGDVNSMVIRVSSDHLSGRFEVETCDFMTRTVMIFGSKKQKDSKKKLQWLKETCLQISVPDKAIKGN